MPQLTIPPTNQRSWSLSSRHSNGPPESPLKCAIKFYLLCWIILIVVKAETEKHHRWKTDLHGFAVYPTTGTPDSACPFTPPNKMNITAINRRDEVDNGRVPVPRYRRPNLITYTARSYRNSINGVFSINGIWINNYPRATFAFTKRKRFV